MSTENQPDLLAAVRDAAATIEDAAADEGWAFSAEQSAYGVGVEVLVSEEPETWIRAEEIEECQPVLAVRLYDCDGGGVTCRTEREIEDEVLRWQGVEITMPAELAAQLRQARLDLGLTQVDLAERVGVSQRAISDWEAGKSRPRELPTWARLATALGVALVIDASGTRLVEPHSLPRK